MAVELREPPRPAAEDALVEELEELWAASPDPIGAGPRRRRRGILYDAFARGVAWGWPSVLVAIFVLAPAPAPDQTYAGWVVGASIAILLGPLVAGLLALNGWTGPALGLSGVLGGLGIAVGIACRATAHHTGSWWMVETTMFAALTALSVACLALRARS
ncbi:MAG: hypothetical protein ICV71_02175 [Thermoleophilia bacterium]|nr:hypothetical protein [Thermoleophilia bacterium]